MNREYRRGLITHPCGAPVLRISVVDVLSPTFTYLGAACQEAQDPLPASELLPAEGKTVLEML